MTRPLSARLKDVLRSRPGQWLLRIAGRTPFRRYLLSGTYDPHTGFVLGSGDMERDWDERARLNAKYFIIVGDADSEQQFRESGERDVREVVLNNIDLPRDARVLEIGCGIGRLLRPLAALAAEVHGVDISREMLRQAVDALSDLPNVRVHHTSGDLRMFDDASIDFCFSLLVFQHIPDPGAVAAYIREAGRVVKPGGTFRFQITLSESESERRRGGGTWFGAVFREADVRALLTSAGFEIASLDQLPQDNALWTSAMVTARRI
jgi:SAM-dependent methyltransferase